VDLRAVRGLSGLELAFPARWPPAAALWRALAAVARNADGIRWPLQPALSPIELVCWRLEPPWGGGCCDPGVALVWPSTAAAWRWHGFGLANCHSPSVDEES